VSKLFELSKISIALACIVAIGFSAGFTQAQDEGATLKIGSKAPDLDVRYWLSDNDGMFQHTTKLEEDNVYVVEFWATWCGPCIGVMPYIAELQEKYKDQKVQIISVSDEDLDTVEDFLERKVPGDKEKRTFGELTNSYCLTTDPDKSVKEDYFRAAKRSGIPCAFVVGKTGLIEWIGHPGKLGIPLKRIVEDKWDRNEFIAEENKKREAEKKHILSRQKLRNSIGEIQELANSDDCLRQFYRRRTD
jgi:thiol-disulfide isomerase/thioredoxin